MPREEKSARELAEIVAARLQIPGAFISVHPSDGMGWSATAASRPGMVLFTQQLVDEIVKELRNQYSLKTERRL